jgi:manganese/iron transport system permease protein/iron/zinc/copper transport system permease protein
MILSTIDFFIEPLSSGFFKRGLIAAFFVMIGGAVLGFGVITRRYAYLGQGISQSMLGGVAIGSLAGFHPTLSAFAAAILASILISRLSKVKGLTPDTSVAIVASAAVSIGVAIISSDRSRAVNLNNILFGNILGVTWLELSILGLAVLFATIFTLTQGRKLALASISPSVAEAHGVRVSRLELYRLFVLAVVTAASVQIVGVTLIVAALVLPAAISSLFAKTIGFTHILAIIFAIKIGFIGMYISYGFDIATGPSIIITGTAYYLLALLVSWIREQN